MGAAAAFHSIRSERQLMEQLEFNLLFRWFVGFGIDDRVWDATMFTKNRVSGFCLAKWRRAFWLIWSRCPR